MIIAGLTGGIASGKSTAACLFKEAGAVILDADRIAHQVVTPGMPAWHAICDVFGRRVLNTDQSINRVALGDVVFNNPDLRKKLEKIIHPYVLNQFKSEISQLHRTAPHTVVIQDVPLLFEKGLTKGMAEIIVVYTPAILQLRRLMRRDGMALAAARARINAQMPIEEKCRRATIIINNSGELSAIRQQVLHVYADLALRARCKA